MKQGWAYWYLLLCLLFLMSAVVLVAGEFIADRATPTSLIRLVAHPKKYHGKRIELIGYYRSDLEHSGLYLTKDDAEIPNYQSGVWIGAVAKNADTNKITFVKQGFVQVIGTFKYCPKYGAGHMGLWPAEVTDITFFCPRK